jgi:hypothetical protein
VTPFGIPDNVFGVVPEAFYGALGRVAALGALVEMRLGQVVMELERVPETEVAGLQMSQLKDRIETLRKQRAQTARPLPAQLVALVEEAGQAMVRRNELVHSLWSNPTLTEAKGWRPARKKDRLDEANPVAWVLADEPGLQSLIAELVRLARELRDVVSITSAAI